MECLRLTPVSSPPGDSCSRLQEVAAVTLRTAANSDELLVHLLHHGRNLVLDDTAIQQPDDGAVETNLKEPAEKMVNVHRPLSDLHHEMEDFYPVCSVMPSQSIADKNHNVMVTLDRSEQSNANPSGKKSVINTSRCFTSPVSAADTTAEAQLSNDSPDVQITDERNFNESCSQLCKKVDDASNSIISSAKPRDNHSSDYSTASKVQYVIKVRTSCCIRKKPPHDPRRVLLSSDPTSVPETNRFPVSALERRYYGVFCRLGRSERYQCMTAIIYRKVRCSYLSLGQSLMPGGHVNNFLISVFCRKLFDDCHPSVSKKHYFFSYIGENILKYNNKDQFKLIQNTFKSASLEKKIDACELLFFPICHCKHWFLFVVDLQNRQFVFMDSLFRKKSRYQVVVSEMLVGNFKHLWKEIVDAEYSFDNFRTVYPAMPRQGNGNDCGVFVMKCMEIWTPRVVLHDYFSRANIPNIRIQYTNQLFFSSKNTADKSMVTHFLREGKFHRVRTDVTSDSNVSQ
uniref:Ubiquitin-like protease family profile domain-containing protein n=1 Tax=Hordeum vulgare subsp. vulgare TaxID=112509 RepID=A0A8I7BDL7_HORVV